MDQTSTATLQRLRWPLYLSAIGLIIIPLLDFVTSILPLQPYDIRWRFASVALLSGFLFTPLLAIMFLMVVSALAEDRTFQRVVGVLNLVLVVLLGALLVLFALDVLELRHGLPDAERVPFDMSALRATAKYGFMVVILLVLGIVGIRVSRAPRASRASRREAVPLVTSKA